MACMAHIVKHFAILVTFIYAVCDATTSSAQEETCTELHGKKELIQARNSLGAKKDGGEEELEKVEVKLASTQRSATCPWDNTKIGFCHNGQDAVVKCKDGTYPEDWTCKNHGGREKCPCKFGHMCAQKTCGNDGDEHCCEETCEKHGGPRDCGGKKQVESKGEAEMAHPLVGGVVYKKAEEPTPEPTKPKKCYSFHKSWSSVLGDTGISNHDRNTCIVYNRDRSSSSVQHFQGMNDEKNQGAAAAILTLQQNGYDIDRLKTMSEDDQRNTIIVETMKCKPNLSKSHLQGLLTFDIAKEMNTGNCCP